MQEVLTSSICLLVERGPDGDMAPIAPTYDPPPPWIIHHGNLTTMPGPLNLGHSLDSIPMCTLTTATSTPATPNHPKQPQATKGHQGAPSCPRPP